MSTALEIVVRGHASGRYTAQRAMLSLTADFSGTDRDEVYRSAVGVQERVTAALTELEGSDAVSTWHSDSVHVWSYRPVDPKGRPRDLLYVTQIRISAEFVDFERLSAFIDEWAGVEGIDIGGVRWDVTDESRRTHERELRKLAVDDAVSKAQAYADAVGRGPVVAVQLADPDMLPSDPGPMRAMVAGAAPGGSAPALELRARDIEISVSVDARFVAE